MENLRNDAKELKRLGITAKDIADTLEYKHIPVQELSYFGKRGYNSDDSSLENVQNILLKYEDTELCSLLEIFTENYYEEMGEERII